MRLVPAHGATVVRSALLPDMPDECAFFCGPCGRWYDYPADLSGLEAQLHHAAAAEH